MHYKYVFGPVASSRLGRSLGLDLLGAEICTMDCVYCEVGSTRRLTLKREPYAPAGDVLAELAHWARAGHGLPDVVTLGGMGEPTLNSDMAEIMEGARRVMPGVPLAVLTNSTLLGDPEVRRALLRADAVLPSMDALVPEKWRAVNRPHPDLDMAEVAESILDFAREFTGKIYLETLLVRGVNDSQADLDLLRDFLARLKPDRLDVATLTRPGTEENALPVDPATLAHWRQALDACHDARRRHAGQAREMVFVESELAARVAASIARRPQSAAQIARAMEAPSEAVQRVLDRLCADKIAEPREQDGEIFYSVRRG